MTPNFVDLFFKGRPLICQEALPMMKRARCNFVGSTHGGCCEGFFGLKEIPPEKNGGQMFNFLFRNLVDEISEFHFWKICVIGQLFLAALVANPGKSINRGWHQSLLKTQQRVFERCLCIVFFETISLKYIHL